MRVGIHRDHRKGLAHSSARYRDILAFNGIETEVVDSGEPQFWEQLRSLDVFVFDWKHYDEDRQQAHSVIPVVDLELGKRCFPNWATCWHYDDKIKQHWLLQSHGFPSITTWVFWQQEVALEWLESAPLPLVFKLRNGAGSSNVRLVKSLALARNLTERMFGRGIVGGRLPGSFADRFADERASKFLEHTAKDVLERLGFRSRRLRDWQRQKNYVLFQEFLPGNDFDVRVTTVGERALAFRRGNRPDDFRASGSGRILYDTDAIDMRCVELAFEVSRRLGFQTMAYDFLFDANDEPAICEISYRYDDKAVYDCAGYWDPSLEWHAGHNWPQYLQLVDLLQDPSLRQPA